jgi:hypothetical protein
MLKITALSGKKRKERDQKNQIRIPEYVSGNELRVKSEPRVETASG